MSRSPRLSKPTKRSKASPASKSNITTNKTVTERSTGSAPKPSLSLLSPPKMTLIRRTSPEEKKTLHPYSTSRLIAVNMCPIWGVVSSLRRYDTTARSMALEAGSLMHNVFAGVRLWQLKHSQGLPKHAEVTALRTLGKSRWEQVQQAFDWRKDDRDNILAMAFGILKTGGWDDNPNDKTRTMQNMELAAIDYCDERLSVMENWPIYVEDTANPGCMVGIEQVFDVVIEFADGKKIRYIGTVDGLVIKQPRNILCLDEDKTAARLDEGWRQSFELSHQITGYCAAGSIIFGFPVSHARVTGTKIGRGEDVYPLEPAARDKEYINVWANWLYHSVGMYETYKDNYEAAPRYTHSCNRYFRPCSLIPFCGDTPEGRKDQWKSMVAPDMSPSERAIADTAAEKV